MFTYQKRLQYPIKISTPNAKAAKAIISQYGGPDGELGASLRYLSQRYSMPYPELKGLLTDIGTEELEPVCYMQKDRKLTYLRNKSIVKGVSLYRLPFTLLSAL